jgi:hypothetical protein
MRAAAAIAASGILSNVGAARDYARSFINHIRGIILVVSPILLKMMRSCGLECSPIREQLLASSSLHHGPAGGAHGFVNQPRPVTEHGGSRHYGGLRHVF